MIQRVGCGALFAADMDGDGDIDVGSALWNHNRVQWYANDGSQIFTAHTISNESENATGVAAGDMDGDGDMDMVSASGDDDTIAWYQNDGSALPHFYSACHYVFG